MESERISQEFQPSTRAGPSSANGFLELLLKGLRTASIAVGRGAFDPGQYMNEERD